MGMHRPSRRGLIRGSYSSSTTATAITANATCGASGSRGRTVAAATVVPIAFQGRRIGHIPIGIDRRGTQRAQLVVQGDRDRFEGHRTIIGECTIVRVLLGGSI